MPSNVQIYSYSGCTTCKKALRWLDENQIDYQLMDIVQDPPNKDILVDAINQLGDRKKIFNTSGLSYRNLGSMTVKAMSDSEALKALVSDGKLIKRPFLVTEEGKILVGFKPEIWSTILLK